MSLVNDYLTDVKPTINDAISTTFEEFSIERLIDLIHEYSFLNVYGKPNGYTRADGLTERAERARRYTIGVVGREDFSIDDTTLTVTNEKQTQGGLLGEVEGVEEGTLARQPYPRPFMKPALNNYALSDFDRDLIEVLGWLGIEASIDGTANDFFDGEEDELPF